MRPPVLYACLLLILAGSVVLFVRNSSVKSPPAPAIDFSEQARSSFSAQILADLNRAREAEGQEALVLSPSLLESLQKTQLANPANPNVTQLFRHLQEEHPDFFKVATNEASSATTADLALRLQHWKDAIDPNYTDFAVHYFPGTEGTVDCLIAAARRLPQMALPVPHSHHDMVFDQCRLCGEGHAVSLQEVSQNTLIIRCPHCDQHYNLIAMDSQGLWRRANQFLTGFELPSEDRPDAKDRQALALWKSIDAQCQYQADIQRVSGNDSWSLPKETFRATRGDCEDTSLLLADTLISAGFDARVALGRQDGSGHAWCVLRIGDIQYILESTYRGVDQLGRLPRAEDLAFDYHPSFLFDRDTLYFNRYGDWTGNYWSEDIWQAVSYAEEQAPVSEESIPPSLASAP
ncbi:MAG: transglutaminase domain-containing protein [Verrucomicrobiota bacterium]